MFYIHVGAHMNGWMIMCVCHMFFRLFGENKRLIRNGSSIFSTEIVKIIAIGCLYLICPKYFPPILATF